MEKFKITLSDGTELRNLGLNGNNYISKKKLTESVFAGKTDRVVITDPEGNENEYENMELVQIIEQDNGEYWFVLRQLSDLEIRLARFEAFMEASKNVK